jgi:hypothetical protein
MQAGDHVFPGMALASPRARFKLCDGVMATGAVQALRDRRPLMHPSTAGRLRALISSFADVRRLREELQNRSGVVAQATSGIATL